MVTKEHAERLSRALESTGLAQPVSATHNDQRVSVMCRVNSGNEEKWINLVRIILVTTLDEEKEIHAWQAHICRNYFIKEIEGGDRKLVWGWNVSIHSREMSLALEMLIRVIKGQVIRTTKPGEVTEFPLYGASPNRNAPTAGGKGVHTLGDREFNPARTK